jgi:hypothetical protein
MPSNVTRTRLYAGSGALTVGALAYIGLVDPHRPGALFPGCPFKMLTGWNCPACGGLRMTHDVLHGDLAAAVVDNVFLLIALPMLALWSVWRVRRGEQAFNPAAIAVITIAVVGWTVLRNLPGFPLVPTVFSP